MIPADLEQVVKLCRRLHSRSRYAAIKPHWPTVVQTIIAAGTTPKGIVLVADHDEQLTGILIGVVQEYWWTEAKLGARVASDLLFFSQHIGDGEEMMKQFIAWAWSVPRVVRVEVGVSSGIKTDRAEEFYRKMGMTYMGPMFVADHPRLEESKCLAS